MQGDRALKSLVKIFREIFSWDFEGFARPKRERIVEYFQEDFRLRFLVEIFSKILLKILQKILTDVARLLNCEKEK